MRRLTDYTERGAYDKVLAGIRLAIESLKCLIKAMSKNFEWITPDSNLLEKETTDIQPPKKYHVVLNNDDYTPMDFVIEVLERFFSHDIEKATQIMLKVHYEGKAICGTYSAEIAETKVAQVTMYSRENEHPLLCTMEQA